MACETPPRPPLIPRPDVYHERMAEADRLRSKRGEEKSGSRADHKAVTSQRESEGVLPPPLESTGDVDLTGLPGPRRANATQRARDTHAHTETKKREGNPNR